MITNRARILEIKIVPFISFVSIKKDSVGMERMKFFKKKTTISDTSKIIHLKSAYIWNVFYLFHSDWARLISQFHVLSPIFSFFNWNISIVSNEYEQQLFNILWKMGRTICRTCNVWFGGWKWYNQKKMWEKRTWNMCMQAEAASFGSVCNIRHRLFYTYPMNPI